jgi:ubiquinone/menaquinone biosynthesis C-methylase UbiE
MDKNQIAIKTYEKIADRYTNQYFNDFTDRVYLDLFLNKVQKNGTIVDIGCGPGQFSYYIDQKGFKVIGVDYSAEMIKIAREKNPKLEFLHLDMRNLSFNENSIDGLLAAYSLIHIPSQDIQKTINRFYKVVKPGGYIEIIVQKGEQDRIVKEPLMPTEKMFVNFFTVEKLSNYLLNAMFTVIYQTEAKSQDPESMSDTIIYIIAQKPI